MMMTNSAQQIISLYNNTELRSLSEPNMYATVDKIRLKTTSFEVSKKAQLTIQPVTVNLNGESNHRNSYLFTDAYGKPQYGQKAYLNVPERVNLSISNFKGTPQCSISINPNKLHHKYKAVDSFDMTLSGVESIQYELKEYGIEFDLASSLIIRLDMMKQKQLSDSLMAHHLVLSSMAGKWQKRWSYNQTYVFGNDQHETMFYDKGEESKLAVENFIRCEIRALKAKSVRAIYGLKTYSDLLNTDSLHLNNAYNKHLIDRVIGEMNPKHSYCSIIDIIQFYVNHYGQSGIQKFLIAFGMLFIREELHSDKILYDAILNSGSHPSSAKRWVCKFRKMLRQLSSIMDGRVWDQSRLYNNILSFAS